MRHSLGLPIRYEFYLLLIPPLLISSAILIFCLVEMRLLADVDHRCADLTRNPEDPENSGFPITTLGNDKQKRYIL